MNNWVANNHFSYARCEVLYRRNFDSYFFIWRNFFAGGRLFQYKLHSPGSSYHGWRRKVNFHKLRVLFKHRTGCWRRKVENNSVQDSVPLTEEQPEPENEQEVPVETPVVEETSIAEPSPSPAPELEPASEPLVEAAEPPAETESIAAEGLLWYNNF